ncbi:uncharacterized protein LOC118744595 [Rhagoletis pomonella]|uniref:uncharacterized protein LOC118744595 n=1 Tax=Rhagoletis pomonella TaxID=28610 RepID=UPI00177C54F7|nr:uncharacterized protein LOC118744595 [Rhagoletis pomonella]
MLHLKSLALAPASKALTTAMPTLYNTQQRSLVSNKTEKVSRPHCLYLEPRCSKDKMKKVTCKKREFPLDFNFDECCKGCKDVLPRFDDLYYKPSDKSERKYQQTWSECPDIFIVPMKLCCTEYYAVSKMEKRKHKKLEVDQLEDIVVRLCRNKLSARCSKISWPGCKAVRDPPKCTATKKSSGCSKICTPYPSYSECEKKSPKFLRPAECKCLKVTSCY